MKKSSYTLEEATKLYEQYKNLHKVAKELHTSHISLSKFFKDNGMQIENVGKERILTDDEINQMIKSYDVDFLTIDEIAKNNNAIKYSYDIYIKICSKYNLF